MKQSRPSLREPREAAERLRCLRYYYWETASDGDIGLGCCPSTTEMRALVELPVPMRTATPLLTVSSVADFQAVTTSGFDTTNLALLSMNSFTRVRVAATTTGLTAGHAGALRFDGGGTRWIAFSADVGRLTAHKPLCPCLLYAEGLRKSTIVSRRRQLS